MADQFSNNLNELQNVPAETQEIDELFSELEQNNGLENRVFLALFPSEKFGFARYSYAENEISCGTQVSIHSVVYY